MLSLLKKLWNWLKSLFIASPKAINPKEVKNTPPEPSDGEYEGILMGLFEQVAAGTTTGGLRGWLYSRHCDDKKLARWLGVKSEEWLRYPEDYQTLGRDLAALGRVMTGNLGEVSQRISLQLRDAVRDVSSVEGENLCSKETDLTEVVQDAEFWFEQGTQKYMNGDFIGAIASYDQALEIKPDFHLAWLIRGGALYNLGRFEEAIASYDRVLEIKPDLHEAWFIRGAALVNLGRFEQAIASHDRALEFKPDKHEAWYNRGNALGNLGRFEQAIASYDKALEIKPDDHLAWYNRGVALGNLGRWAEAIASFDQALEIQPDLHQAWNNRGFALGNLGRWAEAIASYDKALEIKPDLHQAWTNRENALRNLGRVDGENLGSKETDLTEVQKFYQLLNQGKTSTTQGLSTANNTSIVQDAEFWFEQGTQKYMNGDFIGAIASYDQALKIQPDFRLAWYNRGNGLYNLGRLEEAIASYDQALEIQPDYHEAWYNRGVALANLGRWAEEIASYDKALEIKPDYHEAWTNRENALRNLGRL